jgi:hypothetical protein
MIKILLMIFLSFFILGKVLEMFLKKRNSYFDMYFGVPGSGKTTFAAYLARKASKRKKKVYCNVDIKGTYEIEKTDIGYYDMSNGLLEIDEAGLEFNNRNFKTNFDAQQLSFFKKHRHYKTDVVMFSQFWNDADIKLRNLTTRIFILKKSIFPFCITRKQIGKRVGINDMTKEIIDEYYFIPLSRKINWRFSSLV